MIGQLCLIFLFCVLIFLVWKFTYWKRLNVPCSTPWSICGHLTKTVFQIESVFVTSQKYYMKFYDKPMFGMYFFWKPILIIKDPVIAQRITKTDFHKFNSRGLANNPSFDPLSNNIAAMKTDNWKFTRTKLQPIFGYPKIKLMYPLIEKAVGTFLDYLEKKNGERFESKTESSKFTMSVICSIALGIDLDDFIYTDTTPEIVRQAQQAFNIQANPFKSFGSIFYPDLLKKYRIKSVPASTEKYIVGLIKDVVKERLTTGLERQDFLGMLIQLQKNSFESGDPREIELFSDSTLAAHSYMFLVAGHETSATLVGPILYYLKRNPNVLKKLQNEMKSVFETHGQFTFESMKELKYLDDIIHETLRLLPVAGMLRECLEDYEIPELNLTIPKSTKIIIPSYSIHRDEQYYEEPLKFWPERFQLHPPMPGTYYGFGDGPRYCIGTFLAMTEIKLLITRIISKFEYSINEKTVEPFTLDPGSLVTQPYGGVWLEFKKKQ